LAKDDATGQLVPVVSPLMLTTNKDTQEWTISVLNDKIVGSTALIGTAIQQVSSDQPQALPTFDRTKAKEVLAKVNARGSGYYPDEVQRLAKNSGCKRLFTGNVTFVLTSALAMAATYNQYEIDNNQLTFNVDGQEIKISQGALRKVLARRIKELEDERAKLMAATNDPDRIAQTDDLLKKYGTQKAELGEVATPDFTNLKPAFMDLLAASNGEFHILVVDQYGACVEIAAGNGFDWKS
jgi:hypothetical protein